MTTEQGWRFGKRSITRRTALFLIGLGAFIYLVVVEKSDRPSLVVASLALMGLPLFLRADDIKVGNGKEASSG